MRNIGLVAGSALLCFGVLLSAYLFGAWLGPSEPVVEEIPEATVEIVPLPLPPAPLDVGKVPTFWSDHSIGHGCPVSPTRALTAKHVAVDRETDKANALVWADEYGHSGVTVIVNIPTFRDIAVVDKVLGHDFPYTFALSAVNATVGETVYIAAYDYENNLEQRLHEAKMIRNRGGSMIYTPTAGPGSSGSCIFRKDGSVVGINVAEIGLTGLGVSVVGEWNVLDREVVE